MFHERMKERPCTNLKCSCTHSTDLESPAQSWGKICPMLNESPGKPEKSVDHEKNKYVFSRTYGYCSLGLKNILFSSKSTY